MDIPTSSDYNDITAFLSDCGQYNDYLKERAYGFSPAL